MSEKLECPDCVGLGYDHSWGPEDPCDFCNGKGFLTWDEMFYAVNFQRKLMAERIEALERQLEEKDNA